MHYLNFRDNYIEEEIWIYADILFRVLQICFLLYWLVHAELYKGNNDFADIVCNKISVFLCYLSVHRDVQKQKALVKNESLLTILSGETLQHDTAHINL